MNLKKCLFISLLCAAQSNFCMDHVVKKRTAPNDGQEWIEMRSAEDLRRFAGPYHGKLAAVSFTMSGEWTTSRGNDYTYHPYPCNTCFNMPQRNLEIHYARIQNNTIATRIDVLGATDKHSFHSDTHRFIFPGFIRGLTLPEMREIMQGTVVYSLCHSFHCRKAFERYPQQYSQHYFDQLAKEFGYELEARKNDFKQLDNLTPKEQQNYVLKKSGILTLLGIRAKRRTIMSHLPKELLRDRIIKPLIAPETERLSKNLLEL